MRRRLTLSRETLSELSLPELSIVVGAQATGEFTCDVSVTLVDFVTHAVFGPGMPTTETCTTIVTSIIK